MLCTSQQDLTCTHFEHLANNAAISGFTSLIFLWVLRCVLLNKPEHYAHSELLANNAAVTLFYLLVSLWVLLCVLLNRLQHYALSEQSVQPKPYFIARSTLSVLKKKKKGRVPQTSCRTLCCFRAALPSPLHGRRSGGTKWGAGTACRWQPGGGRRKARRWNPRWPCESGSSRTAWPCTGSRGGRGRISAPGRKCGILAVGCSRSTLRGWSERGNWW